MHIQHHSLKIPRSAHYFRTGPEREKIQAVWLVCHGYGQSAERFIKKFRFLDADKNLVLAPEGLSRFYWNDIRGEVVASWMTSKYREAEIDEHTQFLNVILKKELPSHSCPVFMIGFSQGTATIFRFLDRFRPVFQAVVIWSGKLPRDVNYQINSAYWSDKHLHYFYGNNDPYITPDLLQKETEFMRSLPVKTFIHPFEGEHRVYPEILKSVLAREILKSTNLL